MGRHGFLIDCADCGRNFDIAGFELRTDIEDDKIIRWPDHYSDPRGTEMWERVCNLVNATGSAGCCYER